MRYLYLLFLSVSLFAQNLRQTNTQLTVIPLPPIPNVGNALGANTTFFDPAYGGTTLRCTDINTLPGGDGPNNSWEVTDGGGSYERSWNANGKRLHAVAAGSGTTFAVNFDPVSFTCSPAIPGSQTGVGTEWSHVNPDIDYRPLNGTQVWLRTFNGSNPPTSVPFFDFKSCPGLATLNPIWHSPLQITVDDSLFAMAFSDLGGQDTGEWVAMYQPATGGCQTWNTLTGVVTGHGFGVSGTISVSQRFNIHDMAMGPGGVLSVASGTICTGCGPHGPFLFKAGGLEAHMPTLDSSGHNNIGWSKWANCVGPNCTIRSWNNVNSVVQISRAIGFSWPPNTQQHMSWRPDVLETYPLQLGSSTVSILQPVVITTPLQQELFLVNMDGTYTRLAHTFTSGVQNSFNFRAAFAISSQSDQGCTVWSSDWMQTLGLTPSKEFRSDVFIICRR